MEKRKQPSRCNAPRGNAPRANALSYAVPSETDPDGMYTGIPVHSGSPARSGSHVPSGSPAYSGISAHGGVFSAPQTAVPDAAFPGGKTYCSADNVSRLIAMQSDPDAPTQDADDL